MNEDKTTPNASACAEIEHNNSRSELPINEIKESFFEALSTKNQIVLTAPPGAGKSTLLPLWLLQDQFNNFEKIYLLQPRRIAAKNIASYLANQLNEPVGQQVGYRLRNENKVSKNTRLEVITEGTLTQIIQNDPELNKCNLIIFDEFHERSVHADLALALALDVQQNLREDLTIMLMSATLASNELQQYFPDAAMLESKGRSFPVEVEYSPALNIKLWRQHLIKEIKANTATSKASILVFLPGTGDIRFIARELKGAMSDDVLICPLFGDLSLKEQQQAIAPAKSGMRKVVLATNIAETSLTIEGVDFVIDSGFEKVAFYDAQTMTNRLQQQACSKASAIQRAGRAGRLRPGKCLRLFSAEDFGRRLEQSISEIQQTDLLPTLIEAVRWGVAALDGLPLVELPDRVKEGIAWQELKALNIVDENHRLTKHGENVGRYGTHPRFAHMIASAIELEKEQSGTIALACILSALLEERDLFSREQQNDSIDLRKRLYLIQKLKQGQKSGKGGEGRIHAISQQASRLYTQTNTKGDCWRQSLPIEEFTGILLALAYPERISQCRGQAGKYLAQSGKGLSFNDQDGMALEPAIVAAHMMNFNHQLIAVLAAPVSFEQLQSLGIIEPKWQEDLQYDGSQDRISARKDLKLGAISLAHQKLPISDASDKVSALWLAQLRKNGLNWLNVKDTVQSFLMRWRWLNQFQSHLNLPDASESSLLACAENWFAPFVGDIKSKAQLQKLDYADMLLSMLDYQQQKLVKQCAPTHFVGPTDRRCKIRYSEERSPTVSMPMQELYGEKNTPQVGDVEHNKGIPLILELLSPAQRPIQVTQDLPTFWQGSYQAVQKDMKSQYPKHFWPDEPQNAAPTRKTKRHLKNS